MLTINLLWVLWPFRIVKYIANSSWHWGSYGSIWTGLSPKKYYMDRGPYAIFFGDGLVHTLPYNPKWHELFAILYFLSKIIMQIPFRKSNRKRGSLVPVHKTLYWSAALTKTNRKNKNVKYSIEFYQ